MYAHSLALGHRSFQPSTTARHRESILDAPGMRTTYPPLLLGRGSGVLRPTGAVLVKDSRAAPLRLDLPTPVSHMVLEDSRRCTFGARISM